MESDSIAFQSIAWRMLGNKWIRQALATFPQRSSIFASCPSECRRTEMYASMWKQFDNAVQYRGQRNGIPWNPEH